MAKDIAPIEFNERNLSSCKQACTVSLREQQLNEMRQDVAIKRPPPGGICANGLNNNEKLDPFRVPVESGKIGRFRHAIAILALSSIVLANMNRQAYNQALVQMVRTKVSPNTDGADFAAPDARIYLDMSKLTEEPQATGMTQNGTHAGERNAGEDDDRFDWDGSQISLLQAAFAYGYTPFMIPSGRLSEIYGAKWVIFLSGFGSAVCSLLTPLLADNSFALLVVARMLMGVCQTGVSPSLYALLTRWLPPEESSVYLAMIKVGVMIGFMLGSLINGFLAWRIMFFIVGLIGLMWSLMWTICVSSSPEEHRFLSQSELVFIKQRLSKQADEVENFREATKESGTDKRGKTSAPWWNIITNPVVIAFTLTKFTVKLSTDAQSIEIPMYLKKVFQVSDQVNGVLNGVNFAIQAVFTGVVAFIAKELIVKKTCGLNKTGVRRLFQGINNFGMALAYLMISFNFGSLAIVCCAVILLSITSMFGSGGESVLPVDLTTEYAASIMAIANCTANLSGIVLPTMVSFILNDQLTSHLHWNRVWWLVSGLLFIGGLIFGFFVEADLQDFHAKSKKEKSIVKGITIVEIDQAKSQVSLVKFNRIKY